MLENSRDIAGPISSIDRIMRMLRDDAEDSEKSSNAASWSFYDQNSTCNNGRQARPSVSMDYDRHRALMATEEQLPNTLRQQKEDAEFDELTRLILKDFPERENMHDLLNAAKEDPYQAELLLMTFSSACSLELNPNTAFQPQKPSLDNNTASTRSSSSTQRTCRTKDSTGAANLLGVLDNMRVMITNPSKKKDDKEIVKSLIQVLQGYLEDTQRVSNCSHNSDTRRNNAELNIFDDRFEYLNESMEQVLPSPIDYNSHQTGKFVGSSTSSKIGTFSFKKESLKAEVAGSNSNYDSAAIILGGQEASLASISFELSSTNRYKDAPRHHTFECHYGNVDEGEEIMIDMNDSMVETEYIPPPTTMRTPRTVINDYSNQKDTAAKQQADSTLKSTRSSGNHQSSGDVQYRYQKMPSMVNSTSDYILPQTTGKKSGQRNLFSIQEASQECSMQSSSANKSIQSTKFQVKKPNHFDQGYQKHAYLEDDKENQNTSNFVKYCNQPLELDQYSMMMSTCPKDGDLDIFFHEGLMQTDPNISAMIRTSRSSYVNMSCDH